MATIPQPPGIPLLGNLFTITPSNTWACLKKLAEQYGEIFQITVLGRTVVFVASVALAEELCDQARFRKFVGGPVVEIRAAVHDALFTAFDHEPSWGVAHRIMAPHLSAAAVRQRGFLEMRDLANELVAKWERLGPRAAVSPLAELQRLDLETTTFTLLGARLHCLDGPPHPMLQAMEDATSEAMLRPTRPGCLNLLRRGRFKRAIRTMREYADRVVRHRRDNPTGRDDLLAAMLDARDPETGEKLTDSQVVDEIVSMPIGSSTAPCLLATAIFLLLRNPEAVARARQELDAVAPGGRELAADDLDRLHYVHAVVRESLRLSFAAPGFNIEPVPSASRAPVQLAGGKYQVAHDQAIIVVMAGVNRDPAVFDDPLAFRPERMLPDQLAALPDGAKKWFGNGKRECIGKHHAWQWSVLVLATLLAKVDFAMADAEYELEQDGWFNYRPVGFMANVTVR
ncbi:uncharacterized protein UV8b_00804 [Ustilaginoidea virens]|uniref:Cytochrome P450 n=1 Tax=Ustilaginoidea virens TaxID=1159556 RepID=A0A063BY02_USTVR|nr:uncharacterized protein UV8b_00804 [Ustilaginoidea virens]QUC16563.1 hypothetical protein UV8b_00804 [Ustilaginoidea virens]GAO16635.1 hypothetical protein UVI_02012560 [Ustilaginoidea virens]